MFGPVYGETKEEGHWLHRIHLFVTISLPFLHSLPHRFPSPLPSRVGIGFYAVIAIPWGFSAGRCQGHVLWAAREGSGSIARESAQRGTEERRGSATSEDGQRPLGSGLRGRTPLHQMRMEDRHGHTQEHAQVHDGIQGGHKHAQRAHQTPYTP